MSSKKLGWNRVLAGLVVMVIAVVCGVAYYSTRQHTALPTPAQKTSRPDTSKKPATTASQPAANAKSVKLPGANPFAWPTENVTVSDPASLWVIVSKTYPLADQHYTPTDLTKPAVAVRTDKPAEEQKLRAAAAHALEQLFAAANTAGHQLLLASGFRSYELQQTYFANYSRSYGETAANQFSARPGQSEHQTGWSVDISRADRQCYLDTCFGETEAGKWLVANAATYGFILRYPADKTATTQYQYEPWHFRYVGTDLAKALTTSGLTLDEARPYLTN